MILLLLLLLLFFFAASDVVVVVVALISFNRDVFASATLLIRVVETSGFRHSRREI